MSGMDMPAVLDVGLKLMKKFDPSTMKILVWLNTFEFIVDILNIPDDKKNYFLLNMIENEPLLMMIKQYSPAEPINALYRDNLFTLQQLYSPYRGVHAARYRFVIRDQIEFESVQRYSEAIMKLCDQCNFGPGATTNLLHRFIYGLRSTGTRYSMMNIPKLTWDEAMIVAREIERIELNRKYGPRC